MKTSALITEMETHLQTFVYNRNPAQSDQLMGYAMLKLKEAKDLLQESVCPSECPRDAVNTRHYEAVRKFLE